jgi:chromosome segregation ATPase
MTETEIEMMKADMDALTYLCRRMLETNEKLRAELREAAMQGMAYDLQFEELQKKLSAVEAERDNLRALSGICNQSINTQAQFQP